MLENSGDSGFKRGRTKSSVATRQPNTTGIDHQSEAMRSHVISPLPFIQILASRGQNEYSSMLRT